MGQPFADLFQAVPFQPLGFCHVGLALSFVSKCSFVLLLSCRLGVDSGHCNLRLLLKRLLQVLKTGCLLLLLLLLWLLLSFQLNSLASDQLLGVDSLLLDRLSLHLRCNFCLLCSLLGLLRIHDLMGSMFSVGDHAHACICDLDSPLAQGAVSRLFCA